MDRVQMNRLLSLRQSFTLGMAPVLQTHVVNKNIVGVAQVPYQTIIPGAGDFAGLGQP